MSFSIFPRTVYQKKSKISGEIVVKEQFGKYTLQVQGVTQSGGIVSLIWKKPINKIHHSKFIIQNSLILGLGGGTAVQLIKQHWPKAKIVGVEIDPEIIKVGKKFFGLGKIRNLEIVVAHAINRVECFSVLKHDDKKGFDLILVDLYLGKEFLKKAAGEKFLKNIKKLLTKNGLVVINRLRTDKTNDFEKKLRKIFSQVELVKTMTNLFFLARSG